jgi:Cu-Zn family superoxide dismutase
MQAGPHGLLLTLEGENWPQGWHGVHLHAVGTCEAPSFSSAGSHVNHADTPHPHGLLNWDGGPDSGDLPNAYAHADGIARAEVYVARTAAPDVEATARSTGLALIVHASPDDHQSQPIGGAGARIACAVLYPAPPLAED